MTITIADYTFEGPYTSTYSLQNRSGVYVILCTRNGTNHVIDVGESAEVRERVENHDRRSCWTRNCTGNIRYAVRYTPNQPQTGRMEIEQQIRRRYRPPCGET